MLQLKNLNLLESQQQLGSLPEGKLLINTINAHSYNTAQYDGLFAQALQHGDVLIPDGVSIVKACRLINAKSQPKERCAGWDLFVYEMNRLNEIGKQKATDKDSKKTLSSIQKPKVMFMGSSDHVLSLIRIRAAWEYPYLEVVTYSPPYKDEFTSEDDAAIINAINSANPDLLWVGMTAPKQEKWTYLHWQQLNINCHVGTIGAVFDFFAGTTQRAPLFWQRHGIEWLYRLLKEPRRMFRRYVIGNPLFLWNIYREKMH